MRRLRSGLKPGSELSGLDRDQFVVIFGTNDSVNVHWDIKPVHSHENATSVQSIACFVYMKMQQEMFLNRDARPWKNTLSSWGPSSRLCYANSYHKARLRQAVQI